MYLGEESEESKRKDRAAAGFPPKSAQPNSCGRLLLLHEEMYNSLIMEGLHLNVVFFSSMCYWKESIPMRFYVDFFFESGFYL